MAAQVTNYQCPACTGPLQFDAASGKLACEYCGTIFEVAEIEALYTQKDAQAAAAQTEAAAMAAQMGEDADNAGWDLSALSEDWGAEADGMRAYNCPSCGAELICDATTAATACPYCGNPTIVPGQFTGALKPHYVIPFKLDKQAAISALKKHYEGRILLPKTFKDENHLQEIKGLYVPFWLFNGEAEGQVSYTGTRVSTYRTANYEVTRTDHYNIYRAGSLAFERIPVDGSTKMPDDYMDSIEPFDYQDLAPFSTAYLPGYMADKYDVTADACAERADSRAQNSLLSSLRDTVIGYTTVFERDKHVHLKRGAVQYAMLPVWLLTTQWKGNRYLFAMNGQTGKMVGDLPVDKKKRWAIFGLVYGATALVTAAIVLLANLL